MAKSLLSDLNPEQQRAVTYGGGPLLILAGPGSGKTRALTYRAAYLILEKGVPAENVLLLTFTNKAADEMKSRIRALMEHGTGNMEHKSPRILNTPPKARLAKGGTYHIPNTLPFAGTFHSFCARVLRREGHRLGWPPNFLIYDEGDSKDAIREVLKKLGLSPKDFNPGSVLATISGAKNELIGPKNYPEIARGRWQEVVALIYSAYQKNLKEAVALDFDDLLTETVGLFKNNPDILEKYRNIYKYILVDEYHDTNHAQYELTKLLVGQEQNLTVVADCSQSIYSFRGADFTNVLRLKTDFSGLATINLEQNYRSTRKILAAAYSVISHNRSHPILKIWTKNKEGELVKLIEAGSEREEAESIVEIINTLYSMPHTPYSHFAILYRTNAQSRSLEEALLERGIPYIIVGGVRFYERKEIKDVIAYLRLLANPKDLVSYKRIEKLGKGRLQKFLEFSPRHSNNINHWSTTEILDRVLRGTDYLEIYDPKNEEDFARLENIKELRSVAAQFPDLNEFLENVALIQREYLPSNRSQQSNNAVTLMTLHAAKGLEFPVVFIVGLEEGLLPHSRSLLSIPELEEERRLFYVGITRAKEKLHLSFTRRRLYFGQRSASMVSRFIGEIPEELLEFGS